MEHRVLVELVAVESVLLQAFLMQDRGQIILVVAAAVEPIVLVALADLA
jgi:hypothetical protein